jgi:hypothetical protein
LSHCTRHEITAFKYVVPLPSRDQCWE